MSVRNHSSTARTSQCMKKKRDHVSHLEAKFDFHTPSHTSGYPFEHLHHMEHLNHYPAATTAADYGELLKSAGSYLSPLNPMNGAFNPAGKIMKSTIGFDPTYSGTNTQEYVSHALLELVRVGFNLVIAKKILDTAISMSFNILDTSGKLNRDAVISLARRMGLLKE